MVIVDRNFWIVGDLAQVSQATRVIKDADDISGGGVGGGGGGGESTTSARILESLERTIPRESILKSCPLAN